MIVVKTEEEMLSQLKILLNNGYSVAVCKDNNMELPDTQEYTIAYTKKEDNIGVDIVEIDGKLIEP